MNNKGLRKLSYGVYIINTINSGCIVNTLTQVTSDKVIVAINKDNYTNQMIKTYKKFNATVLTQKTNMEVIQTFGFTSSKDNDKYKLFQTEKDSNNIPYIKEKMASLIECEVINEIDLDTHTIFIAKVINTEILSDEEVMTYDYYHKVKKGVTPPKAPTYEKPKKGYRCKICGYIYEGETLPIDFVCPICGAPASVFEKIE